jgi:hypothetical protein
VSPEVLRPVVIALSIVTAGVHSAAADSATQITQVTSSTPCGTCQIILLDPDETPVDQGGVQFGEAFRGPPNTMRTYQIGNGNVAVSLSLGKRNSVTTLQYGNENESLVGIVADDAHVTVVQVGNEREAQLLVMGTPPSPIGVIQGPNDAPVHAAILTDRDGDMLIAPGQATVVITGAGN